MLKQVAQLSQTDRAAGWVSYDWNWETIFYGHLSSTTVTLLASKAIEFGEKKRKIRAITPFKVIQRHRGRYQSKARICDFLVINTNCSDIVSRTVSELSQLIVQILDTLRFEPPLGGLGIGKR